MQRTRNSAEFKREAVTLTKRGKPVVRIVPAGELNPKPKLDLAALAKFRASLPRFPLRSAIMLPGQP